MSEKFSNVPLDDETLILFHVEAKLGDRDILYQKWEWDGIRAESIIFASEDLKGVKEDEIKLEVRSSPLVKKDSKITFKHGDSGFTFVNFNFSIIDDEGAYIEPELSPEEARQRKQKVSDWIGQKNRAVIERLGGKTTDVYIR
ncbi:MAG: hypothetical protein ACE5DZ_01930 [Mariprofundus sp.]